MSDDASQLTPEQKKMAIAWLNSRGAGEPTCPGCGQKGWNIGGHLVAPPIHAGGMILGGTAYPNFMIICNNCGNTQYFNAVMAKIVEPSKEEEKQEEEEEKSKAAEKLEEASDG